MRLTPHDFLNPSKELHMQHQKLFALRQTVISVALGAAGMLAFSSAHAETPKAIASKVDDAAVAASSVQIKPVKLPKDAKTTANGLSSKVGDNAIPGTAPIPQPKPRKDALEAGALKAKAKAAQ
jgi:hypothetical protein